MSPSSRGLGHRPFTAVTGVRIPLGTPLILYIGLLFFSHSTSAVLLYEFDAGSAGNSDLEWVDTQGHGSLKTGTEQNGNTAIHFSSDTRSGFSKEYRASSANLNAGDASGLQNNTYTLEFWIRFATPIAPGQVIFETGGRSNGLGLFTSNNGLTLATSSSVTGADTAISVSFSSLDTSHYLQIIAVYDTGMNRISLQARDVTGAEVSASAVSAQALFTGNANGMSLFGGGNGNFSAVLGDTGGAGASGLNLPVNPGVFSGSISLFRIYTGVEEDAVTTSFNRNTLNAQRSADSRPNIIVIFTDDHGYADLGIQGQDQNVLTPHIDDLARNGIRFTHGYVTSPQCVPSRAGMLSGQYQQRFGVVENGKGPMAQSVITIPERLRKAGYRTGMIGKWHLDPNQTDIEWAAANNVNPSAIPESMKRPYYPDQQGFDEYAFGNNNNYWLNYNRDGTDDRPTGVTQTESGHRVDIQSDFSVAFIERNHARPFFLYLAYFAPHLPLETVPRYENSFNPSLPVKRRIALGMIKAMDDGIGRIMDKLVERNIDEQTIIWFIGDNGAPLGFHEAGNVGATDASENWDGSLNTPWLGEKGMLSEGGIRVPWIMWWKGTLSPQVYHQPVISLDVAATANELAGLPETSELDGTNLIPYLTGILTGAPHASLYWQFWNQRALREGRWKYISLAANSGEFLFDLESDIHEKANVAGQYPQLVQAFNNKLALWQSEVSAASLSTASLNSQENSWYRHSFGLGVPDYDGDLDGVGNLTDRFPDNPTETSDTDMDSIGDNTDADDDNDLLPDGFELEYGLDPKSPVDAAIDTDMDGLSNYREFQLGLNLLDPDTDSDGVNDGQEIDYKRNPLLNENNVLLIINSGMSTDD